MSQKQPEDVDTRSTLRGSVGRGSWADIVRDMGATESTTAAMKNASKGKECKFHSLKTIRNVKTSLKGLTMFIST
jgi:hypothetical protein